MIEDYLINIFPIINNIMPNIIHFYYALSMFSFEHANFQDLFTYFLHFLLFCYFYLNTYIFFRSYHILFNINFTDMYFISSRIHQIFFKILHNKVCVYIYIYIQNIIFSVFSEFLTYLCYENEIKTFASI